MVGRWGSLLVLLGISVAAWVQLFTGVPASQRPTMFLSGLLSLMAAVLEGAQIVRRLSRDR